MPQVPPNYDAPRGVEVSIMCAESRRKMSLNGKDLARAKTACEYACEECNADFECYPPSFANPFMIFHRRLIILICLALGTGYLLFTGDFLVNTTHSMELGLYYRTKAPIGKGSLVSYRLNLESPAQRVGIERGYDRGGVPLLTRSGTSWSRTHLAAEQLFVTRYRHRKMVMIALPSSARAL